MSQELFDEALRLEDEGQPERALIVFRKVTELAPTRNAFLRLGGVAKQLGLVEEAEQAFTRALARDGNETAAEVAYQRAIRLDPGYEEAYYNLGVLLRQNGRHSEAQPLLRTAIELDPVYAAAHRELGYSLFESGNGPDAEARLRKAIDLAPADSWAHIYLGTYLFESDPEAAEVEFRTAEKLEPEWCVPLWSLGNLYKSKDLAAAQSFFERALALDPGNPTALRGLERIAGKRGTV